MCEIRGDFDCETVHTLSDQEHIWSSKVYGQDGEWDLLCINVASKDAERDELWELALFIAYGLAIAGLSTYME